MPLEGHWERTRTPISTLPGRDMRVLLVGALVASAIALVVLVSAIANKRPSASSGCRREVVAMSTGGATIQHCGGRRP